MAALLNECSTTYFTKMRECTEQMVINIQATPDTPYEVILISPLGVRYVFDIESDSSGNITLDMSEMPDRLLNRWAGIFTIRIFNDSDCDPIAFTVCDKGYNTIAFEVIKAVPVTASHNLICHCD